MRKRKSGLWHTIYSIISTVIEELAIAALLLWILPIFGVSVPPWAVAALLAGYAVFSYIMYRVGHPTVLYEGVTGAEAIVGSMGTVETVLPEAFVRVQGELWKASCPGGDLKVGEEVIVETIDGLLLTVSKKTA